LSAVSQLLIDVDDATVKFGSLTIIDRLSLGIHQGEFVGLIGPNGAGKTTFLRAILGLQELTSGSIKLSGATMSYIPQQGAQYNAIVPISVLEVVKLGCNGSSNKALEALQSVDMAETASKRFNELSGGQQQRVTIAKALASNADIIFLDEPTTGIDERSQREFFALLKTLQEKGITIVMVSHEVDTVLTLVTRVICLNRTIVYDGPPEHFEADKYLPKFYKERHVQLHHHHGEMHA